MKNHFVSQSYRWLLYTAFTVITFFDGTTQFFSGCRVIVNLLMVIKQVGICCLYLVIMADSLNVVSFMMLLV